MYVMMTSPVFVTVSCMFRYIMTSEHTKEKTRQFFQQHSYFGLSAENVVLFEQHMLPCFTFEGNIILADKHKVWLSLD